ncbi:hypothetical protein AM588_10008051 [Phytophthora nicotianae]|uniref:J domain-containing protein n=1 Tax=Phytophthora nicotianae TaxID=4792 RepID=A0A0W8DBC6_PHYNI|nr:hypothetical protein AM588_10008051 [Phytophthora nicotianae]
MAEVDYYETLGIQKTATEEEIKRAYRKMASATTQCSKRTERCWGQPAAAKWTSIAVPIGGGNLLLIFFLLWIMGVPFSYLWIALMLFSYLGLV